MTVFCLGISHHTANVPVREHFAVPPSAWPEALRALRAGSVVREAVLLSTCNRVEVYGVAGEEIHPAAAICGEFLTRHGGREAVFYRHAGAACARHLFRVACGLDSMIVGETEILGQAKRAYATALGCGATSAVLNRLFQQAFRTAKRVRAETGIGRGPASIGSATVDLAESVFGTLAGRRVLLLGAGEAAGKVARSLRSRGVRGVAVANRTFVRAAALAAELHGTPVPFEEWRAALAEADILISSTSSEHRLLEAADLRGILARRDGRPLLLLDLAVPRDLDPAIAGLPGAHLHDLDSLQAVARQGLDLRRRERERCEAVIEEHVGRFAEWLRGRELLEEPHTLLHACAI